MEQCGRQNIKGDGDPLDVCVLTERTIAHGDILATVKPIGGFCMLDGDEADDKIIAVLHNDATSLGRAIYAWSSASLPISARCSRRGLSATAP